MDQSERVGEIHIIHQSEKMGMLLMISEKGREKKYGSGRKGWENVIYK